MQVLWNRHEVIVFVDDDLTVKLSPENAQEMIDDLEEALLTIEGPDNRSISRAAAPLKPINAGLETDSLLSAEVAATMDSAGVSSSGKTPVLFDDIQPLSNVSADLLSASRVPRDRFATSAVGGTPPELQKASPINPGRPLMPCDQFLAGIVPHPSQSHQILMDGRAWNVGDAARIRNALSLAIDTQTQKSFALPATLSPDQAANLAATNGDQ